MYNMEERKMLEELWETRRRGLFYSRLACVLTGALLAVLIGALVWTAPRAVRLLDHANRSLEEIDTILSVVNRLSGEDSAANLADKLAELDISRLNGTLAKLDGLDLSGVEQALNALSGVDFERLNAAMNTLDSIREPLLRFAAMLGN